MRLPRMTTRRWMIAVAVVAFVAGLIQRHNNFQQLAAWHRSRVFRIPASPGLGVAVSGSLTSKVDYWRIDEKGNVWLLPQLARKNAWHRQMAVKYEHAARYPWLPVEPDPPIPE
jgi:hypothetical protein